MSYDTFKPREDLSSFAYMPKLLESTFIEIESKKSNIVVGQGGSEKIERGCKKIAFKIKFQWAEGGFHLRRRAPGELLVRFGNF